jgi:hypothetical protein
MNNEANKLRGFWGLIPRRRRSPSTGSQHHAALSKQLVALSRVPTAEVLQSFGSSRQGLTDNEAERRFVTLGANRLTRARPQSIPRQLIGRSINPMNTLLLVLAALSAFSKRLVRGFVAHANAGHSHHPHEKDPVYAEPRECAPDRHHHHHQRHRSTAAVLLSSGAIGLDRSA